MSFARLVAITLFAASPAVAETVEPPLRVVIQIGEGNWSGGHYDLVIARSDHGFSDGSRQLNERLVTELIARVVQPPIASLDPDRLGVNRDRLHAEATRFARNYPPRTA